MKKLFFMLALSGVAITSSYSVDQTNTLSIVSDISNVDGWEKAKGGMWPGKDNVWYKLDDKANVWWSTDGKKWEASKDGMWQDKDGKWLKIGNGKLWWSKDGKEWAEVPEWKWQAEDGKWYKFDQKWMLWVNN